MSELVIILAPGSRARLIVNQTARGPDLVICDVRNPMRVIEDDGSEGDMNLKPQYLIFHWFPSEAMMRAYFDDLVGAAIEAEREACAKIVDEEAGDMDGLASHSQKVHHWETMSGAQMSAKAARKIAAVIRARSEQGSVAEGHKNV